MIRRPPRSTLSSSSAASDVYKRQVSTQSTGGTSANMAMALALRAMSWMLIVTLASSRASSERRIVGGVPATSSDYPWFATLTRVGGRPITCGASLINKRWAVTACHCVIKGDYTGYYGDGEITFGCNSVRGPGCIRRSIKRFVHHPCYTISCCDDHDDVCLIELNDDAIVSHYAKVAGLHGTVSLPTGSPVTLVGSGSTGHGMGKMMKVNVDTVSQAACEAHEPYAIQQKLINFSNVICTGGVAGKDSCGGDSGSPVIGCYGGEDWVLGVLVKGTQLPENGPSCGAAGRYAVYTRLDHYTDFLRISRDGGTFDCPGTQCHKQGHGSCTAFNPSDTPVLSCSIPTDSPTDSPTAVSYTHLRAHETPEHLVCRLLLEKKKKKHIKYCKHK
eukprot:TRINITY_DN19930_c0_g1_i1.p1 TRINITY_DN19930_c0_g1~~TRINITY_DN19930_c0_g1_i1.p1  ORF type:complete len:389 (+),score=74.64 TRINITY_DN19930_c0_g1_i1:111-1277(+)